MAKWGGGDAVDEEEANINPFTRSEQWKRIRRWSTISSAIINNHEFKIAKNSVIKMCSSCFLKLVLLRLTPYSILSTSTGVDGKRGEAKHESMIQ